MRVAVRVIRHNRDYRYLWLGHVLSEIGDGFGNIAVVTLAVQAATSPLVITWLMVSRALPIIFGGPLVGVVLDRYDRKRLMVAGVLVRAALVLGFLQYKEPRDAWVLYVLSGLLMFATCTFTSGRSSVLPTIVSAEDLHAANALNQATQWASMAVGSLAAGAMITAYGIAPAFVANSVLFLISAFAVSRLSGDRGTFRAPGDSDGGAKIQAWQEYVEGLRYIRSVPVVAAISLLGVGWALGGGAAQVLFAIFGELVFEKGAAGTGMLWAFAGIGHFMGATLATAAGEGLKYPAYKKAIGVGYVLGGIFYVIFSHMQVFLLALLAMMLSRLALSYCSALNMSRLLHTVPDRYRGRVFATFQTLTWTTMMVSMMLAGLGLLYFTPRTVASVAGLLTVSTGLLWMWADRCGLLGSEATASS